MPPVTAPHEPDVGASELNFEMPIPPSPPALADKQEAQVGSELVLALVQLVPDQPRRFPGEVLITHFGLFKLT